MTQITPDNRALMQAIQDVDLAAVRRALPKARPEASGWEMLSAAAATGNLEIVEMLLPKLSHESTKAAVSAATAGHRPMLRRLLVTGHVDPGGLQDAVRVVAARGEMDLLADLLAHVVIAKDSQPSLEPAFAAAAATGKMKALRLLFSTLPKPSPHCIDEAIKAAMLYNQAAVLVCLARHATFGKTSIALLNLAARTGHHPLMTALLSSVPELRDHLRAAMDLAATLPNTTVIQQLVEFQRSHRPAWKPSGGLLKSAANNPAALAILVPMVKSKVGDKALLEAVRRQNVDSVRLLLPLVDLNHNDLDILETAARLADLKILSELLPAAGTPSQIESQLRLNRVTYPLHAHNMIIAFLDCARLSDTSPAADPPQFVSDTAPPAAPKL